MTKEQEGAIKYLEDMKNNLKDLNKSGYVYAKENIETVLNMLKETSAESAEKDKIIAEKSVEIEKLKGDFKIIDEECSRLEKKEVKQDKIIDLMSEFISRYHCFEMVVYDLNDECTHEHECKDCIKQYFEQKATNDV